VHRAPQGDPEERRDAAADILPEAASANRAVFFDAARRAANRRISIAILQRIEKERDGYTGLGTTGSPRRAPTTSRPPSSLVLRGGLLDGGRSGTPWVFNAS